MTIYYEEREAAEPRDREQALMARLPAALRHARERAPAIARQLQGVEPAAIRERADLELIPVIRKSELLQAQLAAREEEKKGKIKKAKIK